MLWQTDGNPIESDPSFVVNSKSRSRNKILLPPLLNTGKLNIPNKLEGNMMSKSETSAENALFTPMAYKYPMSPSNLSLRFNFDDVPNSEKTNAALTGIAQKKTNVCGDTVLKRGALHSDKNDKERDMSKGRWLNTRRSTDFGYGKLVSDKTKAQTERKSKTMKVGQYQQLRVASKVERESLHPKRSVTRPVKVDSSSAPANKGSRSLHMKLGVKTSDQRKGSVYGLHEFLSLPTNDGHASNTKIRKSDKKTERKKEYDQGMLHDANKYDIKEFLKLPTDGKCTTEKGGAQGGESLEKPFKTRSLKKSKKEDIPSVVIADWGIENKAISSSKRVGVERNRSKHLSRCPERQTSVAAAKSPVKDGRPTYGLHEFLKLPITTVYPTNMTAQDIRRRLSRELEERELDRASQYDLREFLNVLDTHNPNSGGGKDARHLTRAQTSPVPGTTRIPEKSRSLSMYDIYEILKDPTLSGLTNDRDQAVGQHHENGTTFLNLTFPQTPSKNKQVGQKGRSKKETENKVHKSISGSTYNLNEFLKLPTNENGGHKTRTK